MQNKQGTIINDDFLLQNKTSIILYNDYAKNMPIVDYHNHLPPDQIAHNKKFNSLTEIWLKGDHYKWRAMRALGVNEKYITGKDSSDLEKFMAWSTCFPETIRNPLFHWSQLELKNSFGINEYLNESSAKKIFEHCNELLQNDALSTKGILKSYHVEMLGTTDDPCDNLDYHKKLKEDEFEIKVLPSFRPDKIFNIANRNAFIDYLNQIENASGISIKTFPQLIAALEIRMDYFHLHGCRIADHGLHKMPDHFEFNNALEKEFEKFIQESDAIFSDPERFIGAVLIELCKMYHKREWVQQFHLGAIRNNNSRLLNLIGADAGVDSIGDYKQAVALSNILNALDKENKLTKTILYNINPADNETFASMCLNFNEGLIKGKIQYGSGWWFLDQKDGIEKQLNALSNMGIISNFVGMLTDSRSFLSFSRHEYFRRILCNLFGDEMEKGLLPNDIKWIGGILQNICYNNAKTYFNL
ncbi:MAG: glucuronate isomerase [Bacteroidota bacterium]